MMKILALLVICMLPTLAFTANILCVFSVSSYSHQKPLLNLAKALSLKDHNVTVITTDPMNDKTLTYLTEIDISHLYDITRKKRFDKVLSSELSLWNNMNGLRNLFDVTGEAIFETKEVKNLINNDNTFDIVIVESHDPVFFAFGPKFHAPLIGE